MIEYDFNIASEKEIEVHLRKTSDRFTPPLDTYVNIEEYATKIKNNSNTFEAWNDKNLIGLIAVYMNRENKIAYITSVSVFKEYLKKGIASTLLSRCIQFYKKLNFFRIDLEVFAINKYAVGFYRKKGFKIMQNESNTYIMSLNIKRDYNEELKDTSDHKYAYNFDFDVMHPFMLKSFKPFFVDGNLLELGSFKGDFTKCCLPFFSDITCVEASDLAIGIAKERLGESIKYINATFETVNLPVKYDNILLTHVLEHLDNPVSILKRINDEWLTDNGRLFLVCPNANAPSRQIAVKMGLISHNSAITDAEKKHGHNITYSLDTLERDAKKAGLITVHRSGIFFKVLANFQWDRLLQTDIISEDYLEGCYQLGQQYPDLCSSIFLVCEKG